ncbi:hypothetical protein ATCC90586_006519 [Pythium insidiosum]|nr:hypothetical protein ATCC90586_006519 [Pythium insidiosum]
MDTTTIPSVPTSAVAAAIEAASASTRALRPRKTQAGGDSASAATRNAVGAEGSSAARKSSKKAGTTARSTGKARGGKANASTSTGSAATRGQVKPTQPGRAVGRQDTSRPMAEANYGGAIAPVRRGSSGVSVSAGHATVPQPIFTFVTAPKLTDTSHEALTRWHDLRLEYEEAIKARCKTTGEDLSAVMVSVRNSFDEALLDTLCEIKWERTKDELTEKFLWDWVLDTVENFKNKTLPDIDDLFQQELVMVLNKGDVDAQVTEYFHLCNTIIRTNGLTGLFKRDDGTKKKCKILVSCLPPKLKRKVKNEIDFRLPEAKSSVPELFKVVSEKALELEREERAVRSSKRPAGPVNIVEPVECLVLTCDDDEVLLGRDVLSTLGIDVERQIEQLAAPNTNDGDDTADEQAFESTFTPTELKAAIERMVDAARDDGFPTDKLDQLKAVCVRYDIWRCELGGDPPARVPPMKIRLKKGAKPFKTKARKYPPEYQVFLESFNAELVEAGWVKENPSSRWACAALPVRKQGGREFRQTVDYKPVNAQVEPIAGIMPNLHVDLQNVRDCTCFGLFDFIKGYWQLPLDESSQEILSYMTHRRIYTPLRVPQGCSDAALFFQSTMERCFKPLLFKWLLVWIDDLLLFARDVDEYLHKLEELFGLVDMYGFKLSALKSKLFKSTVKWCGKIINGKGVSHDPARIQALQDLPYPTNAGELQQFLCSTNWMRDSLVDYARAVRPLQDALDRAMSTASRRTKRVAAGIPVVLTGDERKVFDAVKQGLAGSAELAFPNPEADVCLLTDASDVGWAVVVTQVESWAVDKRPQDQAHQLLICMGGTFTGPQKNWSVIEKEAYPIISACDKLSYLLLRPSGFKLYCDHRNLIHVFAPGREVKKHVRGKLLRWAMKLIEYRYSIEHIDGVHNVWADMISRWAGNHIAAPTSVKRVMLRAVRTQGKRKRASPQPTIRAPLRPFSDGEFVWPTVAEIKAAQQQHDQEKPKQTELDPNGLLTIRGCIWVPESDRGLVQRLLVVAHCGAQGHRGREALLTTIKLRFFVRGLRPMVDDFLASCLLCQHVKGGKVVIRPWAETFRSKERNGALHWDYLTLGESYGGYKYLLVLKDDATHYCELVPCAVPSSAVTAEAILDWHSRFGAPSLWISDQGSHFKNQVVAEVARRLGCQQNFVLAYSPWINGSIERLNRDIVQVLRAMCLEAKVDIQDWVFFVPVLQASLNHTPVPSLGNKAPIELFCALPALSPLDFCLDGPRSRMVDLGDPSQWETKMSKVRESVRAMHKVAEQERSKQTKRNKLKAKQAQTPNFDVGDYVLRSRVDQKHQDKLQVTWVGPYQVVGSDTHSFRVRHLVTGAERDVHPSRLKFYADESFEVTEDILEHVAAQGIVLSVAGLRDHRWNDSKSQYELLVEWTGLEPIENSWESLNSLYKDIPALELQ